MSSPHSAPAVFKTQVPTYLFLGVYMRVLLSSRQTDGQFSMIEGVMPPGGDGGLHIHDREDESMIILEGEVEVTIGNEVQTLKAGSSYFAPRGVPQRLRNRRSAPMRGIVVTTPGGFDEFIANAGLRVKCTAEEAFALPSVPPSADQIVQLLQLAKSFGILIIEPPAF